MKLYKVPNKTWVRVIDDGDHIDEVFFDHIDGAYSLCYTERGMPCHYSATTEVEIISDSRNINPKAPT